MTRRAIWVILAGAALLWPGRVSGPLDGIPFDTAIDVVALGLAFPAVCWFNPRFLTTRLAKGCVVGVLALKAFSSAALVQDGWCATVHPSRAYVRDQTGLPHSWDVRADWRQPDPTCTGVMTRGYSSLEEFPVWFFNLPSANGEGPEAADIPPDATSRITIAGFLTASESGVLRLRATPDVNTTTTIDGRTVDAASGTSVGAGRHRIAIDAMLTGDRWRLMPLWNDRSVFDAAVATMAEPSAIDPWIRPLVRWTTAAMAALLLTAWLISTLRPIADRWTMGWVIGSSGVLVLDGLYVSQYRWHYAVAALALCAALPFGKPSRSSVRVFALVGIPWLVFVAIFAWHDIGRLMRYATGNDFWQFQRYAYRIYLQGYWLEGGERAFWFQPLYRWIAGALHLIFGDSSGGEKFWDAAGLLTMATFAFHAVKASAGPRWGLAAAAGTLALFMSGPGLLFVGRGLSEISSAAFIYMGAMFAMRSRHRSIPWAITAGVCATLGVYTRLNNLPMAAAIACFAWPPRAASAQAWRRETWRRVSRPTLLIVPAVLVAGLGLFALRTWYYTGVFSIVYGTQAALLSAWQPGRPIRDGLHTVVNTIMIMLSTTDPPTLHTGAIPLMIAALLALGGLARLKPLERLPFALCVFALSSLAGALVAHVGSYTGRFSIHLIGAMTAVLACALSQAWTAALRIARPKIEPATTA